MATRPRGPGRACGSAEARAAWVKDVGFAFGDAQAQGLARADGMLPKEPQGDLMAVAIRDDIGVAAEVFNML